MYRFFFLALLLPIWGRADWDQLFSENEDPTLFQHVNVITGNLNLSFEDAVAEGALPLALTRSYSSSGALERSPQLSDLYLQALRGGWIVQSGWSLLAHTNLLLDPSTDRKECRAYLSEPSGGMISYSFSHKETGSSYVIFLRPTKSMSQCAGRLSDRTNPQNNLLKIDLEAGVAVLLLPNGGTRTYRGDPYRIHAGTWQKSFYRLETEVLPSRHQIRYVYDDKTNLRKIEATDPSGKKVYSSITFDDIESEKRPFSVIAKTSDQKRVEYRSVRSEGRDYLSAVKSSCRPEEKSQLTPGRKGIGARLASFALSGKEQFRALYHTPKDAKQERKWVEKSDQKEFQIDKVEALFAPVGQDGKEIAVARFTYQPGKTDVRDADGLLIRYHYADERLNLIEYFDDQEQLYSSQRFYWNGTQLRCKAMFDKSGKPLFAKTFAYEGGNAVEERLWGQFTGNDIAPLEIDEEGEVSGGESYRKTYTYYTENFNLLKTESEEEGPTHEYFYKAGTDLMTMKFVRDQQGRILIREFYGYDEENLLASEIVDNGSADCIDDLSDVTQRLEKRYERNEKSGLPETISEWYLDPPSHKMKLLKKTCLTYLNQKVSEEAVYDTEDVCRYTLKIDYDPAGRIKRKTTPSGAQYTNKFDALGHLEEFKEPGSPKKIHQYDLAGRQILTSLADTQKSIGASYDIKGRMCSQTDAKGNTTIHIYDHFGNCKETRFPATKDTDGQIYTPIAKFEYDLQHNVILAQMPLGETTRTSYNILRKPIYLLQADGTEIRHVYNKNGSLAKTLYSDNTYACYGYDLFQRMTKKSIYSESNELLSQETWVYDAFSRRSYTDSRGLTTHFKYDGAGRKVAEEALDRVITFSYDPLGFLRKTDNGVVAHIQVCDVQGRVEDQWDEDRLERIENRMQSFYDLDNRKWKTIRHTSQGPAEDLFTYDSEGRLRQHTDPNKNISKIIYDDSFQNSLGQHVLQRTTMDPLGNATIETYDAGDRLVLCKKRDPEGRAVAKTQFFYDRSGNRSKQISSVYLQGTLSKEIGVSWKFDSMGRVKQEIEADQKTTDYDYDTKGRMKRRVLPSGITLFFHYDGADRLEKLNSSDGTVHYEYIYQQGPDPVQIIDRVQSKTLTRIYNLFGELCQETNLNGVQLSWTYDATGRCDFFTLPDGSSVRYTFAGAHMEAVQRKDAKKTLLYEHCYLSFDPNGHIAEEALVLGLGKVRTSHDLLERPENQTSAWMAHLFAYGPSGLVVKKENTLFGTKTYSHDALNQLSKEGDREYAFDSLGNPADCRMNDLNQILETSECILAYDNDGNPKERATGKKVVRYEYDALSRLTEVLYPKEKKICYSYDPLSRLLAKETYQYWFGFWKKEQKSYFLYDKENEIGTLDEAFHLLEFKVLGLGIQGDIGAAVSIEIGSKIYAPLHDFNGHVIALIGANGRIAETYDPDAFGRELKPKTHVNPWRFCSKRSEEGLIFFGLRFYDPELGRWLTPDPSGFADGHNLYAYALNSPLNRLDLFGLFSEDPFHDSMRSVHIMANTSMIPRVPGIQALVCQGLIKGVEVDFYVICGHWHQMQYTPEEAHIGQVDILAHLQELVPRTGKTIGLFTYLNGIYTDSNGFQNNCKFLYSNLNSSVLSINLHNPHEGKANDISRFDKEWQGILTAIVELNSVFVGETLERLHAINKELVWGYVPHSEGGVIEFNTLDGLSEERQDLAREHLAVFAVAPGKPIPKFYALEASNVWSNKDYITKRFGKAFFGSPFFDIRILECCSNWSQKTAGFADHAIQGATYAKESKTHFDMWRGKYGFYNGDAR